jgi:DNA-directed RNA polymerase subunit RPC12/RpoP
LIDSLLNLVFRCGHRRLTRPVTPVTRGEVTHAETYVVCLDCGKHFSYDAKEMRLGKLIEPSHADAPSSTPNSFKRALLAIVPTLAVFFLALFGIKRKR